MKNSLGFVVQLFLFFHITLFCMVCTMRLANYDRLPWIHHKLRCIHRSMYDGSIIHYDVSIVYVTMYSYDEYIGIIQNTSLHFVKRCNFISITSLLSPKKAPRLGLFLISFSFYFSQMYHF